MHAEAPAVEFLPPGSWHTMQVDWETAPTALENFPAAHASHTVFTPFVSLYVPATQLLHIEEAVPSEYLPSEQSSQDADPVTALYFPGMHEMQLPAVPLYPALHVHSVTALLPAGDVLYNGHSEQAELACVAA